MRAFALQVSCVGAALCSAAALADEGAFGSHVGGGVALRTAPGQAATAMRGDVLLQLTYGLVDRLNYEAATHVAIGGGEVRLSFSSVAEWVAYRSNHLRFNLGAGLAVGVPLPRPSLELGPVVEAALRWTVSWGLGISVSVHGAYLFDVLNPARSGLWVAPALSAFMEL